MKKIFTLLAVAVMAITASAQNIWKTSEAITADQVLVDNDLFKITAFSNANYRADACTICGEEFDGWFQLRTGDPTPSVDNPVPGVESGSTGLSVEVKAAVDLSVYVRRQKGSNGYDSDDNKDLLCANVGTGEAVKGVFTLNDEADAAENYAKGKKTFSLAPGKYVLYRKGSTMRVYGFTWEAGEAEVTPDPAEGETFQVEGYGRFSWGTTFDSYVMPFSYDAQTRHATFTGIFGSDCDVVLNFVIGNPNNDPNMVETTFKSEIVSGLEDPVIVQGGQLSKITGFTGSIILKKDGVNAEKLENIDFGVGSNSQMTVEMDATTKEKVYAFRFGVQGDCYTWDADASDWVAKNNTDFVRFNISIPFVAGPSSGINNVIVDAVDENAPVEYYNIQGVRISEPAAGQIVIRRQGAKVEKVVF